MLQPSSNSGCRQFLDHTTKEVEKQPAHNYLDMNPDVISHTKELQNADTIDFSSLQNFNEGSNRDSIVSSESVELDTHPLLSMS